MSNRKRLAGNHPGGALGEAIEEARAEGHLTKRQHDAGQLLMAYLQMCSGSSAGLVLQFSDRVDPGSLLGFRPCYPGDSVALQMQERISRLLQGLHQHERSQLTWLVVRRELPRWRLADWGKVRSAYKANRTAHAFAVGRLCGLLDSVAELCLPVEA